MSTLALIQNMHPSLNVTDPNQLGGFGRQVYDRFFEVLVEESGHLIQNAHSLSDYQRQYETAARPDVVICAPFPYEGNLAPGFVELQAIKDAFPDTPIIVWSDRSEESLKKTVLDEYHIAEYYTGTLLDSAEDFADLILKHI